MEIAVVWKFHHPQGLWNKQPSVRNNWWVLLFRFHHPSRLQAKERPWTTKVRRTNRSQNTWRRYLALGKPNHKRLVSAWQTPRLDVSNANGNDGNQLEPRTCENEGAIAFHELSPHLGKIFNDAPTLYVSRCIFYFGSNDIPSTMLHQPQHVQWCISHFTSSQATSCMLHVP